MAEKIRYPQIPGTVWWGVRTILQRTPNATIDERLLGVQLGVQEVAARQYIAELVNVGLLTDEGKPTPLAQKWRLDETYNEAVKELIEAVYPESLLHVAPPEDADRQKVVTWFEREGLGRGAAGNKAATYLLLSSATPNEAPSRNNTRPGKDENDKPASTLRRTGRRKDSSVPAVSASDRGSTDKQRLHSSSLDAFPLNINVQIHISADAGSEQIESIFSAMRRYLYEPSNP